MYFDEPGKGNTDRTVRCAFDRARELGINEVIVASSSGDTANKVMDIFEGFKVVVVTYHCGFKEPFKSVMPEDAKRNLEARGAVIVGGTHALSGIERSVAKKYSGFAPVLLMADTLKLFGQGTKVAVEITVMAADAGSLSGRDVAAIGGSSRGADTALILTPVHQNNFFDMKIREIVCKPSNF